MVNLQQESEPKLITPKQEALIYRLLQSKVISKKEYELFYQKIQKQVVTSYDASIVINFLLSTVKFRKMFFSKKQRCKAFCSLCKTREHLKRYAVLPDMKQVYYCNSCEQDAESEANKVLCPSEVSEAVGKLDDKARDYLTKKFESENGR